MSDEEDEMPHFIRAMMASMKEPDEKEKREIDAKNKQAHAAVHGDRNTCEAAVHCALDYLAHDLAGYLCHLTGDEYQKIEMLRDIRALMDKVRKNLKKDLISDEGQVSNKIFVEVRPWRESR